MLTPSCLPKTDVCHLLPEVTLPASPAGAHSWSVFSSTDEKVFLGACLIADGWPLMGFCGHGEPRMESFLLKPFLCLKTSITRSKGLRLGGVFKPGFPRDVSGGGKKKKLLFSFLNIAKALKALKRQQTHWEIPQLSCASYQLHPFRALSA